MNHMCIAKNQTKEKQQTHNNCFVARSKLNGIEKIVPKVLTYAEISHEAFIVVSNEDENY